MPTSFSVLRMPRAQTRLSAAAVLAPLRAAGAPSVSSAAAEPPRGAGPQNARFDASAVTRCEPCAMLGSRKAVGFGCDTPRIAKPTTAEPPCRCRSLGVPRV